MWLHLLAMVLIFVFVWCFPPQLRCFQRSHGLLAALNTTDSIAVPITLSLINDLSQAADMAMSALEAKHTPPRLRTLAMALGHKVRQHPLSISRKDVGVAHGFVRLMPIGPCIHYVQVVNHGMLAGGVALMELDAHTAADVVAGQLYTKLRHAASVFPPKPHTRCV